MIALVAVLLLAGTVRAQPSSPSLSAADSAVFARADFLSLAGRSAAALDLLDSLRVAAVRRQDRSLEARILSARSVAYFFNGRMREAEAAARAALAVAAPTDTLRRMASLRWLAASLSEQGRVLEMRDVWARLLPMAVAKRDRRHEGFAQLGLAFYSMHEGRGRDALPRQLRALEIFRSLGDGFWTRWTLTALGRALGATGDVAAQRRCWQEVAELAAAAGDSGALGDAWNNLASLEWLQGDPAAAEQGFRRAFEIRRAQVGRRDALTAAVNIALCDADLGRFREGATRLESVIQESAERGFLEVRANALSELAGIRRQEGRVEEAIALQRQALALNGTLDFNSEIDVLTGLAFALADAGRGTEAIALLSDARRRFGHRASPGVVPALDYVEGNLRVQNGDAVAGMRLLRSSIAGTARFGRWRTRMEALTALGIAYIAVQEPDSAIALLEFAASLWAEARGVSRDPEWREQEGAKRRRLFASLIPLRLDWPVEVPADRRVAAAFNDLQRYKARTLRERMRGPAPQAEPFEETTLDQIQQRVLRPGELLLETFVTPETTLVFAITRDSARVVRLPGTRLGIGARLRAWHRLISARPARAGVGDLTGLDSSAAQLGRFWLTPFDDLLRASRCVLFAPDGELNLLPLGTLDPGWGTGPLLAAREVVAIPSAGVLALLRDPAVRHSSPRGRSALLALTPASGGSDRPMSGAASEVRWLRRTFVGVASRSPGASATDSSLGIALAQCQILHVATHARLDDERPWLSGLLVDPAGSEDRTRWLRATEVARLRLPARLAVLSACESGRGRVLSGEGVQGLATAFLSAGVPAVVASLWKVEDRATESLMRGFYRRLAAGETVAKALRGAQLDLKRDRRTAHPFFWAGFVVVGEPTVQAELHRKPLDPPTFAVVIGLVIAIVLAILGYRRRQTRMAHVTQSGPMSPIS
ncbi:MAG: CHAT domain-containing protein [Candidatus Eisenbacteria bacterium]|uniref:CHAT domain-containing protein n=1 Tax=Eiseniibacteriota bacterium TaxID=2212470 RepID=A0A849SLQ3_UNCEI|nr:CHAT domain-containing protein [Candidatus Eisenbacteria bacterium]